VFKAHMPTDRALSHVCIVLIQHANVDQL
jgi:hypothetical protein